MELSRLNVAATRAKYAMWLVGSTWTLQEDRDWGSLIRDATSRGCVLDISSDEQMKMVIEESKRRRGKLLELLQEGSNLLDSCPWDSFSL
eukprot:jgi/Mesen1/10579/ME000085S09918